MLPLYENVTNMHRRVALNFYCLRFGKTFLSRMSPRFDWQKTHYFPSRDWIGRIELCRWGSLKRAEIYSGGIPSKQSRNSRQDLFPLLGRVFFFYQSFFQIFFHRSFCLKSFSLRLRHRPCPLPQGQKWRNRKRQGNGVLGRKIKYRSGLGANIITFDCRFQESKVSWSLSKIADQVGTWRLNGLIKWRARWLVFFALFRNYLSLPKTMTV